MAKFEMPPLRGWTLANLFPTAHAVGYVDSAAPRLLSKAKEGPEVLGFKIRHFFENLISRKTGREEIENVTDANTHPPNTWPPATLFGVDRDSIGKLIHRASIATAIGITSSSRTLRHHATS